MPYGSPSPEFWVLLVALDSRVLVGAIGTGHLEKIVPKIIVLKYHFLAPSSNFTVLLTKFFVSRFQFDHQHDVMGIKSDAYTSGSNLKHSYWAKNKKLPIGNFLLTSLTVCGLLLQST